MLSQRNQNKAIQSPNLRGLKKFEADDDKADMKVKIKIQSPIPAFL